MTQGPVQGGQRLQIDIDELTARGKYANLALVSHSETEVVLDFVFRQPGAAAPKVHTRIVLSPLHAKRLLGALLDNIGKYERAVGPIPEK